MADPDFNIWYKSFNESFLYINERSNVADDWLDFSEVLKTPYKDSILKPINKYIYKLCPPPKLISIENDVVTLQQNNFAEIFLLQKKDSESLRAMEKIWVRQFYLSNKNVNIENCFTTTYRWAMPWFIDYDSIDIKIENIDGSPFLFHETMYKSEKNISNRIDTRMLFFNFKSVGSHMIDSEYGRIKRNSPLYLLKFKADDILIEKIKEFYVYN